MARLRLLGDGRFRRAAIRSQGLIKFPFWVDQNLHVYWHALIPDTVAADLPHASSKPFQEFVHAGWSGVHAVTPSVFAVELASARPSISPPGLFGLDQDVKIIGQRRALGG